MFPYIMPASSTSRSQRTTTCDPLSAIEKRFPRIANELSIYWKSPNIDTYINGMLLDDRGDRLGFPLDVLDELMFLAGIRWYLSHLCGTPIESISAEAFNFTGNQNPSQDMTSHDSKSWVLG